MSLRHSLAATPSPSGIIGSATRCRGMSPSSSSAVPGGAGPSPYTKPSLLMAVIDWEELL